MSEPDINENPQPRRRGAPEGNLNALKHGFYSRRFRNGELDDLMRQPTEALQDEIAMLRIINRRVVDMAEEGKSADEILEFYNFIALTSMRLSTLLRTQKLLLTSDKTANDLLTALEKVIDETLAKKGWAGALSAG
ncbi:MAG: hypothetical protein C0391_05410 [Anaerolinea sp.]|nr:hypothetical protein [Anaerolinea sp.]